MGGILVDGYKHGYEAGKKAVEIIKGTPINRVPVLYNTPTTLILDYNVMQEKGIPTEGVPDQYLINKPQTVWSKYKEAIIITLVIIILLLLAIYGLWKSLIISRKSNIEVKGLVNDYTTLVNNTPGVIFRCKIDEKETVLIVGDGIEYLTGYSPEDFIGEDGLRYTSLIVEEDSQRIRRIKDKAIEQRGLYSTEYRINSKEGEVHWVLEKARIILNPQENLLYQDGILLDITHQKQTEEDLEEYRNRLEILVEERTDKLKNVIKELNETQKQLIEASKMASLGLLVSGVAHEINTPAGICLTSTTFISDSINNLEERIRNNELTLGEITSALDSMRNMSDLSISNVNRIINIVRDFKKMSIEESGYNKTEFNISDFFKDKLDSMFIKSGREQYRIDLNIVSDIWLKSYPEVIVRVISYLIDNSVNHGFSDKESNQNIINIDITVKGSILTITYSDNGTGIPEGEISKVFEPFYTTKRGSGHNGLGLNIAYNLVVHKLLGMLDCRNNKLSGKTEFIITIPIN